MLECETKSWPLERRHTFWNPRKRLHDVKALTRSRKEQRASMVKGSDCCGEMGQPPLVACCIGSVASAKRRLQSGSHCYLNILVPCVEVTCAGISPSSLELNWIPVSHSSHNSNTTSVDDAVEGADLRHTNVGDNIPLSSADRGTHTLHAKPTLPHAELKNSVHENMAAPTLTPRPTRARDTTRNTTDGEGRFECACK